MTAQPTEDPADPLVILRDLPECEHEEFLRQYHPGGGCRARPRRLPAVAAPSPRVEPDRDRSRAARLLRGVRSRTRGNGRDSAGHRRDPGLDRTSRRGQGPPVTYRAELSGRALKQMHGLPDLAFDSLIEATAEVVDYPDDPRRRGHRRRHGRGDYSVRRGALADRVGRRPVLAIGFAGTGTAFVLLALAGSFPAILPAVMLYGLAISFVDLGANTVGSAASASTASYWPRGCSPPPDCSSPSPSRPRPAPSAACSWSGSPSPRSFRRRCRWPAAPHPAAPARRSPPSPPPATARSSSARSPSAWSPRPPACASPWPCSS